MTPQWSSPRALGAIALATGLAVAFSADAADWSRFRGPNGVAFSDASNIPTEWDDKTNLAWKTPLPGPGSSSPIVVGDRVFLTCFTGVEGSNVDKLERHLICVSLVDGKILWDKSVPAVLPEDQFRGNIRDHGYTSSTPVSDGDRVYVQFGKTGVFAYDLNGEQLWKTSIGTGLGAMSWGSAASPILYNNLVIVNAAAESKSMVALDKSTGEQKWKSEAPNIYGSRSTPVLVDAPNGQTELAVAAPYEVWGFNPQNGNFLWYADGIADQTVNPSLIAKDGIVYAIGGRQEGSAIAIKSGGKDDAKDNIVWKGSVSAYVPSPVLVDDRILTVSDGVLTAIGLKDGQRIFQKRLPSGGRNGIYASPVAVQDKLYITTRKDGVMVASAKDGEVIAHNRLSDDTDFNASPAIADGKLLLRSNQALYCVSAKK